MVSNEYHGLGPVLDAVRGDGLEPHERVVVALDVPTLREAQGLVEELHGHVGGFKVGLELVTRVGGPRLVRGLREVDTQVPVFYDGKFDDIPNTVGAASAAVSDLAVWAFNVHASAGQSSVRAAVENAGDSRVWAVTLLTSIGRDEAGVIYGEEPEEVVRSLTLTAMAGGAHGVICSPWEALEVRQESTDPGFEVVTPGVRFRDGDRHDQERVASPDTAVRLGANRLVMGRAITQAKDRVAAARRAAEEIQQGLGEDRDG